MKWFLFLFLSFTTNAYWHGPAELSVPGYQVRDCPHFKILYNLIENTFYLSQFQVQCDIFDFSSPRISLHADSGGLYQGQIKVGIYDDNGFHFQIAEQRRVEEYHFRIGPQNFAIFHKYIYWPRRPGIIHFEANLVDSKN